MITDPLLLPVTNPALFTVAVVGAELDQVPPVGVPVNCIELPTHTVVGPDIDTTGCAFTVIVLVAVAVQELPSV